MGDIYTLDWVDTMYVGADDWFEGIVYDSQNVITTGYMLISELPMYTDIYTVKYTTSGDKVWIKSEDYGDIDYSVSIAVDANKNIFLCGSTNFFGDYDWLIVKYDSSGTLLTWRVWGGIDSDRGWDIAVDKNGNIYVSGVLIDTLWVITKFNNDLYFIKEDTISINGAGGEVEISNSGKVFVSGHVVGNEDDWYLAIYDTLLQPQGGRVLLSTLDNDRIKNMKVDRSGNVIIVGNHWVESGGYPEPRAYAMKCAENGGIIWTKEISDVYSSYTAVATGEKNEVVIGGGADTFFIVIKYDSMGSLLWCDSMSHCWSLTDMVMVGDDIYGTGTYLKPVGIGDYKHYFLVMKWSAYHDISLENVLMPDTVKEGTPVNISLCLRNLTDWEEDFPLVCVYETTSDTLYPHLAPNEADTVSSLWNVPFENATRVCTLSFYLLHPGDKNRANDTLRRTVTILEAVPPVIDSAIANDGSVPGTGIDEDDRVILYFSEPTNKPAITSANIDKVLSLSGGHSWRDGFGEIDTVIWNEAGDVMIVELSTQISPPSISVGDTIIPDSSTIQDLNGNPLVQGCVIKGSFDPQVVSDRYFTVSIPAIMGEDAVIEWEVKKEAKYRICVYDISGRKILTPVDGVVKEGRHFINLGNRVKKGIYFIIFENGEEREVYRVIRL